MIDAVLPKANLLGIGVTTAAPAALLDEVSGWIRAREGAHTVAAVNVHTFMEARRSPQYREALNDASIAFVDGVPIRWLLRTSGLEAPPRIHGADLTTLLLGGLQGARHLFYGSTPETLTLLETALERRFPGLKTAGFISPPFRKVATEESPEVLARINDTGADVLWVALGAPKQELWARLNRERIRIPVVACVGAVFEIFAGRFTRAPALMQSLGLEWAWRMGQDPGRLWRRYFATNGSFLTTLAAEFTRHRFPKRPSRSP
jgi:N-acetylglucosaminyldiphosphoundecaprenol N-acetyl-beta-D-mannosaminyltransferase